MKCYICNKEIKNIYHIKKCNNYNIESNLLKYKYIVYNYPILNNKKKLMQWYYNDKKNITDISLENNIKYTYVYFIFKYYNIPLKSNSEKNKDSFYKVKNKFIKKYGIDNPLKLKENREKGKQVLRLKYGAEYYFKSQQGKNMIYEKINNNEIGFKSNKYKSFLNENNIKNISQLPEIKLKKEQTFLKKWNVKNISQSNIIKNKKKKTLLSNYNVDSYAKTKEFKQRMKILFKEKYGIETDTPFNIPEIRKKALLNSRFPNAEKQLINFFEQNNIIYIHNFEIKCGISYRYYDFYLPIYNVLIEYDGYFWHSTKQQKKNDKLKNILAKNNGFRLIRIKEKEYNYKWDIIC